MAGNAVMIGVLLGCVMLVGRMDYQDELASQAAYCEFVQAGKWGDYDPDIPCPWREEDGVHDG